MDSGRSKATWISSVDHLSFSAFIHLLLLCLRFAIVYGPARLWDEDTLHNIMMACIIMHNMIVEDERDEHRGQDDYNFDNMGQYVCDYEDMGERVTVSHDAAPELDAFIRNYKNIKSKETHTQLQADLIEHLWQNHENLYSIE